MLTCGYNVTYSVACDQDCDLDTHLEEQISCSLDVGGRLLADTSTGVNTLQYYDCQDPSDLNSYVQNGPELIFPFRAQQAGDVTFRVDDMVTDHDLYVLEDLCTQSACIAASTQAASGSETLTFTADPAKQYYIVVEAWEGPGAFSLYFDQGCYGVSRGLQQWRRRRRRHSGRLSRRGLLPRSGL